MFNIWKKKKPEGLDQNKRAHSRLDVYHLAKYRLVSKTDSEDFTLAHIKNISGGGVCLYAEQELPASSYLQLLINLPGIDEPVSTIAKVCWIKKVGKSNGYEYGLQFQEINDMVQKGIIKTVDTIIKKTKDA